MGHWKSVITIAKNKSADSNDQSGYGYALVEAACNNQTEAVSALLEAKAPTTSKTSDSWGNHTGLPLHWAARNKNIEMILCSI